MIWSDTQDILFLYILDLVATSLSFLGSLWMCFHCLKSPSPKPVSLKFILAIGLSDFLYSISNFMSAAESTSLTPMCYTEAVFRESSFIASVYFATCTAILCYKTTNFDRVFNQERFFKQALVLGALICIILDILPLFVDAIVYQNGPLFCWITFSPDYNNYIKIAVRIVYELLPFALGIIISLIGYIKAFKKTKELPPEILSFMDVRVTKLFWYPTVMFIVFAPSALDNFAQIFLPFTAPVALKAVHLALTHSIGFVNAIVYGKQRRLYNMKNRKDVYPAEEDTDAHYGTRDAHLSIRVPLRSSVSQTLMKAASQNYTQMET